MLNIYSKTVNASRIVAWFLLALLAIVSVVPIEYRPTTEITPNVDRLVALVVVGVAFGVGYSRQILRIVLLLTVVVAGLELLQLVIPTRHGTVSDFVIKALGLWLGVLLGSGVIRLREHALAREDLPLRNVDKGRL